MTQIGQKLTISVERNLLEVQLDSSAHHIAQVCELNAQDRKRLLQVATDQLNQWNSVRNEVLNTRIQIAKEKGEEEIREVFDEANYKTLDSFYKAARDFLGNEKSKLLDQWLAERITYQRETAVQAFVNHLDKRMFFSNKQFDQMEAMIDGVAGKQLFWLQLTCELEFKVFKIEDLSPLPGGYTARAEKILNEAQLVEWKMVVERELQDIQQIEVPAKVFGLNW